MTTLPTVGTRVRDTRTKNNRGTGDVEEERDTGAREGMLLVHWHQRTTGNYWHTWVSPKNLEVVE